MLDNLFFGYRHDHDMIHIQHWVGDLLSKINLVDKVTDLQTCHKKIIFMHIVDANYHIDLTRQLIANGNYMVFYHLHEVWTFDFDGLFIDCPEAKKFSFILGGNNKTLDTFVIDFFYLRTLSDANIMRAQVYTCDQIHEKKNKPFKYLFLNGAHRPHREKMWNQLDKRKLLDYALKSYLGYEYNASSVCEIPLTRLPIEYESPFSDVDKILNLKNEPRNYMAFKADMYGGHWVDGHLVPKQYTDTYFSLIGETTTDPSYMFITEKTYKPILAGQPFIAISSPGFYQELHKYGFQTFNNVIDESFDHEEDLDTRIELIADQVEKLCASDLAQFLEQTKDICIYNHKHYVDGRNKLYQDTHRGLNQFLDRIVQKFLNQ